METIGDGESLRERTHFIPLKFKRHRFEWASVFLPKDFQEKQTKKPGDVQRGESKFDFH